MKKTGKKALWISSLLAICASVICWTAPVKATAAEASDFDCSYSVSKDKPYLQYGSSEIITYTAQEAAAAGIPEGYSDTVLSVKPISSTASGCGILLDFSAWDVPTALVKELSFRFYIGESEKNTDGKPQLRIMSPVTGQWTYQPGDTASIAGEWATETVKNQNHLFNTLADTEGHLDKFELSLRVAEHVDFYIDSVKLTLVGNDGIAPEITCDSDAVTVSLGAAFELDAFAYDEQDDCVKPLEYVWESGVELDENGLPTAPGDYSLTLHAVDYFGNASTKTITVTMTEPDLEAPVVHLNFTEMYAQVGMIPTLNFEVTDNQRVASVSRVWSKGALDENGALTEGTHTYTVTALDDSNNKTVHKITVYVTSTEPEYDNVIDEETLSPRYTVTFDGENGATYKYGERVKAPADPIREDTEEYTYVFEGWYNGDVAWDFDKDVVLEDTNLVAKWTKIPLSPDDGETSEDSSENENSSSEAPEDSTEKEDSSNPSTSDSESNSEKENSSTSKKKSKGGCSGSMHFSILLPTLLCAGIACKKMRRKED